MNFNVGLALLLAIVLTAPSLSASLENIVKKYDEKFKTFNREQGPGIAFMVIKDGKIIHQKGYGYADIEQKLPITTDTLFDLASVSKQFTAMAIAILEEQGEIDTNQSIRVYLPDLPEYTQSVKVKHLIHHRSGLSEYTNTLFDEKGRQHICNDDIIEYIKTKTSLQFPPNSRFTYCNSNYALLASIVAKVSGMPFEQFIKKAIFFPLDMKASTVLSTATTKEKANLATGYEQWPFFEKCKTLLVDQTAGDGQIATSLKDFYQWIVGIEESKLVSAKTVEKIFTSTGSQPKASSGYGYGWGLREVNGHKVVRHTGGWRGTSTYVAGNREQKLWVVAFSNYEYGLSVYG
ncbi:MAG: serine hydrolase domain-containing protein [Pseudomonadota bacterium]